MSRVKGLKLKIAVTEWVPWVSVRGSLQITLAMWKSDHKVTLRP